VDTAVLVDAEVDLQLGRYGGRPQSGVYFAQNCNLPPRLLLLFFCLLLRSREPAKVVLVMAEPVISDRFRTGLNRVRAIE